MKHTNRQLSETTTADMYRAMDRQHPVTLTYLKEEKDAAGKKTGRLVETVRTIEITEIRTTKAGDVVLRAADRQSGEMRTFRIDRIRSYTTHRTAYVVERPAAETPAAPAFTTPAELTAYELARDEAAADRRYWAVREYHEAA